MKLPAKGVCLVTGLSQPQTRISPGGLFYINVYIAESFKRCDGKVGADFSWACQNMSQMAHVTPHSHQLRSTRLTSMYSEQVSYAIVFLMGHLS